MRLLIETKRLVLRLPVPEDADAIFRKLGVWEVVSVLGSVPWPYVPSMADDWLRMQEEHRRAGTKLSFAIALREAPGDMIGNVSLNDRKGSEAELGYWLGVDYWGRGLMSEAGRAAVAFGFDVWGLETISSGYFDENPASGRVLAKLGFSVTGGEPKACVARNNAKIPHTGVVLKATDWWRGPASATSL